MKRFASLAFVAALVLGLTACADEDTSSDEAATSAPEVTEQPSAGEVVEAEDSDVPTEYKSALRSAETYADMMNMSKAGVFDQLTSEYGDQFTEAEADYAVANLP